MLRDRNSTIRLFTLMRFFTLMVGMMVCSGCLQVQGRHSIFRMWSDYNSYRFPSVTLEKRSRRPYRPTYTEHLQLGYNQSRPTWAVLPAEAIDFMEESAVPPVPPPVDAESLPPGLIPLHPPDSRPAVPEPVPSRSPERPFPDAPTADRHSISDGASPVREQ